MLASSVGSVELLAGQSGHHLYGGGGGGVEIERWCYLSVVLVYLLKTVFSWFTDATILNECVLNAKDRIRSSYLFLQ